MHVDYTVDKESNNLKDDGLVVLAQIVSEDVGIHESLSTLAENVDRFTQKLHLNPGHVQLLHLRHLLTDRIVQLTTRQDQTPLYVFRFCSADQVF